MKDNSKSPVSPNPAFPQEESDSFTPLSVRSLCLLVLLLVVVPGLYKLGSALSHSSDGSPDVDQENPPLEELRPSQSSDSHRPFRSQRLSGNSNPEDLTILNSTSAASKLSASQALNRLEQVIAAAGGQEKETADILKQFARSGAMAELRKLDRRDVESLAQLLTTQMSKQELGSVLEHCLGLPAGQVMAQEDTQATLLSIYDAISGNSVEEVRPSVLMVTDGADADGHITGQTHVLPSGTGRVYAVFENSHVLEGLDQVMAVWRNPDDDQMVFTEFEPVRRGSAYNYVWLDVESGWPEGQYQVELFHPEAQSLLLASESFSVR